MMQVRFVGDLSLAVTIVLAVVCAVGVWRLYRRETSYGAPEPLSWLLPLLRCTAFVLLLLVLSGPILRHRYTIGQLGRVLVFVDNSKSMSLDDKQMPTSQKLLIAQQHGWLPADIVDDTLWQTANRLDETRQELIKAVEDVEVDQLDDHHLASAVAAAHQRLAALGKTLQAYDTVHLDVEDSEGSRSWNRYLEQFHTNLVAASKDLADAGNLVLKVQGLCTEMAESERRLRDWFDISCRGLAESGDASINAALANFDGHSRWSRVEAGLLDPDTGLLPKLVDEHDIELLAMSGDTAVSLWDTYAATPTPTKLDAVPNAPLTDLASALQHELSENLSTSSRRSQAAKTAVLIVSDGRHNRGPAPLETAQQLGNRSVPMFTMGIGTAQEPPDMAILSVEHPKSAHRSDSVRGVIRCKDRLPAGTPFVLQIVHAENVVWQQDLVSQDVAQRRVPFEFSLNEIVARSLEDAPAQVNTNCLAIQLNANIIPIQGEANVENNSAPMRIKTAVRNRAVLMIDGRSRWELRYLRNLFERDEHWESNTVVVGPGTDNPTLRRGEEPGMFPADSASLAKYDLIVFGEVAPHVLGLQDEKAIRRFVEHQGGGLIFIDGSRGHLKNLNPDMLLPLLPIEWRPKQARQIPRSLSLTAAGRNTPALMLAPAEDENSLLWTYLPVPHAAIPVDALAGAETLAELTFSDPGDSNQDDSGDTLPVLVTRKFGAGRVLYCATDETWRWRFKNADKFHQRFWNQVANWVMLEPFTVSDDYVSLDTDSITYLPGEQAHIRVRLRDSAGNAVYEAAAEALLWKDGKVAATVRLEPDDNQGGVFRGQTPALDTGEYEVSIQAAGFSNSALKARVSFSVFSRIDDELRLLACNNELLAGMARVSDGVFVREEQYQELSDLLRPLSTGRVIETETVLWQSYWWFGAIVGCLAVEWLLRKRAGLI